MEKIKLLPPTLEYGGQIMEFRRELLDLGGPDSFAGCGVLRRCESPSQLLVLLEQGSAPETCQPGTVSFSLFLAIRESDNRLVGMIDLRHSLDTPALRTWAGHMGYTVRPDCRGIGYGKEMLRLNLDNARKRGIDRVLITCSQGNIPSERVILANGGQFESTVDADGKTIKRFWITL